MSVCCAAIPEAQARSATCDALWAREFEWEETREEEEEEEREEEDEDEREEEDEERDEDDSPV